jgi:preprotein translocase subunit Sec63
MRLSFFHLLISFGHQLVCCFFLTRSHPDLAKRTTSQKTGCQCEGCYVKKERNDAIKPWETRKRVLKALLLIVLWLLFVFLAYKVSQIEHTHEEYDPYKILGLDQVYNFRYFYIICLGCRCF